MDAEPNQELPEQPDFMTDDMLHTKYISLFIVEAILFFFLGYYFYYKAKNHLKPAKHQDNLAMQSKYTVFLYLSLSNIIRGLSIICIFVCFNRTDDDLTSFFNYVCHVIPTLIFISVFFYYIRFIVEKYYEIKIKKKDIFFAPSLNFFNLIVYTTFFSVTCACLLTEEYKNYMYISLGLSGVLMLILAWFYLYFGIGLAGFYSESDRKEESREKSFIHNKVMFISVVFGVVYFTRGLFCFLTCIDVFSDIYPSFFNINLWDSMVFFFSELLCSCIIGYTKQKEGKKRDVEDELRAGALQNLNNEPARKAIEEFTNLHEPLLIKGAYDEQNQ